MAICSATISEGHSGETLWFFTHLTPESFPLNFIPQQQTHSEFRPTDCTPQLLQRKVGRSSAPCETRIRPMHIRHTWSVMIHSCFLGIRTTSVERCGHEPQRKSRTAFASANLEGWRKPVPLCQANAPRDISAPRQRLAWQSCADQAEAVPWGHSPEHCTPSCARRTCLRNWGKGFF